MSGSVPTVTALDGVYTHQSLPEQEARWNKLLDKFQRRPPCPVRLTIPWSRQHRRRAHRLLYSVLPMGMAHDVIIAVSTDLTPSNDTTYKFKLANLDEELR